MLNRNKSATSPFTSSVAIREIYTLQYWRQNLRPADRTSMNIVDSDQNWIWIHDLERAKTIVIEKAKSQ